MDRPKRRFVAMLGLYGLWLVALGVLAARSSKPPEREGRPPAPAPAGAVAR
jgi:hypothetical protein